jgi:hypothetical protein
LDLLVDCQDPQLLAGALEGLSRRSLTPSDVVLRAFDLQEASAGPCLKTVLSVWMSHPATAWALAVDLVRPRQSLFGTLEQLRWPKHWVPPARLRDVDLARFVHGPAALSALTAADRAAWVVLAPTLATREEHTNRFIHDEALATTCPADRVAWCFQHVPPLAVSAASRVLAHAAKLATGPDYATPFAATATQWLVASGTHEQDVIHAAMAKVEGLAGPEHALATFLRRHQLLTQLGLAPDLPSHRPALSLRV